MRVEKLDRVALQVKNAEKLMDLFSDLFETTFEEYFGGDQTKGEATNQQCERSRTVRVEMHKWVEYNFFGSQVGIIFTAAPYPAPSVSSMWNYVQYTEDCSYNMEEYVQAGLKQGLKQIIFLEHLETGIEYFETTWLSDRDFDRYFAEGWLLQKKYQGAIQIGLGVEVFRSMGSSDG